MAATFATAKADSLRALGANGAGRGQTRPYSAGASKATQTANTAHNGNQNAVTCAMVWRNAEPLEKEKFFSFSVPRKRLRLEQYLRLFSCHLGRSRRFV